MNGGGYLFSKIWIALCKKLLPKKKSKIIENHAIRLTNYYDYLPNETDKKINELLEEIRLIRLSERRLYQKVTDLFATAIDYDSKADQTFNFFKTV